ncbi:MAG: hypothetical protein Q9165_003720 [Trypethelium subeluteriae]
MEEPDDCNDVDILETLDGPTEDKSAGIGVEFECTNVILQSKGCSMEDTYSSKGKTIDQRQGTNWRLTADTTLGAQGLLDAEYILDGTQIKIGTGAAEQAAKDVAQDILAWNPNSESSKPVRIEPYNGPCNTWTIIKPEYGTSSSSLKWLLQITAPMPLEVISDLFEESITKNPPSSKLLPETNYLAKRYKVYVSPEFFQSNPNGIGTSNVGKDVLGFFSLVMSYAKSADEVLHGESAKTLTSIMPRTDFTSIFKMISEKVKGDLSLYDMVKILACYRNYEDEVE